MDYGKFYENSNLAHQVETAPDFWQEQKEMTQQLAAQDAETRTRNRRKRAIARRNQEKAMLMSGGYVAFLSFAVIITCITAGYYIKLQTEVLSHLRSISSLETALAGERLTNDATEKRLKSEVDISDVRDKALSYGMGYAREDQVVYYSLEYPDYMTQYSEIP